ncbi:MAG: divalent-cation tolerance protein CutA [Oligoflexales bacterium]
MTAVLIYITCKDASEAKLIARNLVQEKLIACANILGPINSVYEWDGNICEEEEYVVLLKTCQSKYDTTVSEIKNLHSYDIPCIIQLPIERGNESYLNWITKQVSPN